MQAAAGDARPERSSAEPKTVRGIHVVLRKALADAERLGLVVRNAAAAAKPPVPPKYEHTTWTAEQLARSLDSIEGERLAAAVTLDLYSHVTPAIDAEAAALVASKIFDHRNPRERT